MATRPSEKRAVGETDGPSAGDGQPDEQAEKVQEDLHRYIAPTVGSDDERRFTDSGIEVKRLYDDDDVRPGLEERLGTPGEYPFTRGIHPGMYRDRLWTMRQYAGYATAEETNRRYRYLIEHGSTGLSMAFDLPTQLGRDSDEPLCLGESAPLAPEGSVVDILGDQALDRIADQQDELRLGHHRSDALCDPGAPRQRIRG